jgi:hypothetical protein
MSKEGLLYTDICKTVENEYRKLKDAMEWPPAKHAQDSKAPPSQFGANVAQVANLTDLRIMALIQSGFASGAKSGTCYHCKKPGHWKRECLGCLKFEEGLTAGGMTQKVMTAGSLTRKEKNSRTRERRVLDSLLCCKNLRHLVNFPF